MNERYRILCVDDDVSGLEAKAALLEEEGYSVTAVSCPLRALEFDVTKFHLAVLDFAMPALDGFQLLLHLPAAHASFPIVLLSGMSRDVPNPMRRVFSSWMAATVSSASKRRDPVRCADKNDGAADVINRRYLNAFQLSTKGHLCLRSQELPGK